jgi:hypothetical protein
MATLTAPPPPGSSTDTEVPAPKRPVGSRPDKILVVDDDARIRDLLRRYLTQEGALKSWWPKTARRSTACCCATRST